MRPHLVTLALSSLLLSFAGCSNDTPKQQDQPKQDTLRKDTVAAAPEKEIKPAHPLYNDIARYIAGMQPAGPGGLDSSLRDTKEWRQFAEAFDKNWQKYDSTRLDVIKAWRESELKEVNASANTLFYPFAGADFLNAYTFFPDADTFVLVGLEPVGTVPDFQITNVAPQAKSKGSGKVSDAAEGSEGNVETVDSGKDYFRKVNTSLHAILNFSFFRTKSMAVDFRNEEINGTIHLMLLFIARTGNSVTDIKYVALKPDGEVVRYNTNEEAKADTSTRNRGIEIEFLSPDSSLKRAFYFSVNLADDMLKKNSSFISFMKSMEPYNTYLKSASYLMHNSYFSVVREELILGGSSFVLEDDSGMPLKYFNAEVWDIQLYGTYDRPIPMFSMWTQADLREAYKDSTKVKPLPFGIGYDYRPGTSNLLLAKKKPGALHVPVKNAKAGSEEKADTKSPVKNKN
jgi:hypothetical protein